MNEIYCRCKYLPQSSRRPIIFQSIFSVRHVPSELNPNKIQASDSREISCPTNSHGRRHAKSLHTVVFLIWTECWIFFVFAKTDRRFVAHDPSKSRVRLNISGGGVERRFEKSRTRLGSAPALNTIRDDATWGWWAPRVSRRDSLLWTHKHRFALDNIIRMNHSIRCV